jgi:hypothetical protein
MMAPRKPIADSAKPPAATRPMIVGQFGKALRRSPQRRDHADGRDQDRNHFQQSQVIAEKDEAEDRV